MNLVITPKLKIAVLGLIVFLGILLLIFAVFFNKGTLLIELEPSYTVNIGGYRSFDCDANPCEISLAPGDYFIEITKNGYQAKSLSITIPFFGETTEKPQLELLPESSVLSTWNPDNLDLKAALMPLNFRVSDWNTLKLILNSHPNYQNFQLADERIIIDTGSEMLAYSFESESSSSRFPLETGDQFSFAPGGQSVFALIRSRLFKNQPLVKISPTDELILDQESTADQLEAKQQFYNQKRLAGFLQYIDQAKIIVSPKQLKVAIIDQGSPDEHNLYIIDLELQQRQKALTAAAIYDFNWLSDTGYLVEYRDPSLLVDKIALGDTITDQLETIPMQTTLQATLILSEQSLIYAEALNQGFRLKRLNLTDMSESVLVTFSSLTPPDRIELSNQPDQILALINNNVYSLKLNF